MNKTQIVCWFIFLLRPAYSERQFRCDYLHDETSDIWYKFHIMPEPWLSANLRCQFEGASLASPTKHLWRLMITRMAELGVQAMYTGLSSLTSRGTYETVDGMSVEHPSIVKKWAEGEPNNENNEERCIGVSRTSESAGAGAAADGRLADLRCDRALPYMCVTNNSLPWNQKCGTSDVEYRWFNRTEHCYKVHSLPREFEIAHMACSAEGGYLVVPNSEPEIEHVQRLINAENVAKLNSERENMGAPLGDNYRFYFVGIHDTRYRKRYWRTVQGEAARHWWGRGRAGGASVAHCAVMNAAGELVPLECDSSLSFVCEKTPDSLTCDHVGHPRDLNS